MYRPVRLLLATVLALLVVLSPKVPPTLAQVQDGATLTVLRGQVAVVHPDGSAIQPAASGTVVKAGDEIRTLTKTGALITFYVGTEIEMGEETILVVDKVTVGSGKVDISLKQVLGATLNRVQSLTDPTSSYRIEAGGATAVVRGTTFLLIGPVPTASGNVSALICLDDCDGRTTFSGCPVAPFTAFGVTVDHGKVTSGCETAAVDRGADYFNAGFEAITTFEQTFASANQGDLNPGTANLGREQGQRQADDRERKQNDKDNANNTVALLNPCGVGGGGGGPTGPTLFPGTRSVLEGDVGNTPLNVPVTLFPASTGTVTVNYATTGGSATAGADYVATNGTLTFPPGTTVQNIPILVIGDVAPEAPESIVVTLSNPVGAALPFATAIGQIIDDDTPVQITVDSPSAFEGNIGSANVLTFTARLSRQSTTPTSVDYQTTVAGTATPGVDFTPIAVPLTLTIPAGNLSATFTVNITGDTAPEPNETVVVALTSPSAGAAIATPLATGTILDDDGPLTLNIFNSAVAEGCTGQTPLTFSVQLSHPSATPVSVNFQTADGTAVAGSDYQAASGTLSFAPNVIEQTFAVQVIGDASLEPNETFTVTLSGAIGAAIGTGTATGTILNDD
ncbi:MAG: Calx-beta domain-containing protein [Chloroflexota bacterium]